MFSTLLVLFRLTPPPPTPSGMFSYMYIPFHSDLLSSLALYPLFCSDLPFLSPALSYVQYTTSAVQTHPPPPLPPPTLTLFQWCAEFSAGAVRTYLPCQWYVEFCAHAVQTFQDLLLPCLLQDKSWMKRANSFFHAICVLCSVCM